MRIVAENLAVLAGAGLGFVGVDHQIMRAAVGLLGHERPFQSGGESGPAAPAQPRRLHLVEDPISALLQDRLGAVPGAARPRAREPPVVEPVEILEDAVFVCEHQSRLGSFRSASGGFGAGASRRSAGILAASSCSAAPAWAAVPRPGPPI